MGDDLVAGLGHCSRCCETCFLSVLKCHGVNEGKSNIVARRGWQTRALPAQVSHWSKTLRDRRILRFGQESQKSQSKGKGLNKEKTQSGKNIWSKCGVNIPCNWLTEVSWGESQRRPGDRELGK